MVRSELIYILYFWNLKFAIYLIPSKNQPFTFLVRDSFIKIIIKLGSFACLRAGGTHPPLPGGGGEVLVLRQFCRNLIMLWIFYNTSITFDPVNGFWHSKSHFGVVFWGQHNGDAKSSVTVHISWRQNHYHCISWSTGRIWTIKESFWGSFSRPT